MEQRFKELDFSQSGDTPGDGNCMMLCLVDQMSYSEGLRDFAESAKDLRWKSAKDLDLVSFLHWMYSSHFELRS